jgi:hypothetical protein
MRDMPGSTRLVQQLAGMGGVVRSESIEPLLPSNEQELIQKPWPGTASFVAYPITGLARHPNNTPIPTMDTIRMTYVLSLVLAAGSGLGSEPPQAAHDRAADSGPKEVRSVRETIALYLKHIQHGDSREAFALTTRTSGVSWGNDFPKVLDSNRVRPYHELNADEHAMTISNPFPSRGRKEVFYAFLLKSKGQWLINRSGRAQPDEAVWMMQGYLANPAVEVNACQEELVGNWWAVCDSTIVMSTDGNGTELCVGPGGPVLGVKPEPFKWKVRGAQLLRQFADRDETLEITWLDDNSVSFRQPNDSGWGRWYRRE